MHACTLLDTTADLYLDQACRCRYADLRGAALAVEHLRRRGFDAGDVEVRPRGLRLRPAALAVVSESLRRLVAIIVGGAVAIVTLVLRGWGAAELATATVAATVAGSLVYAAEAVALRWRRSRIARDASVVEVNAFDVVVASDAARAEGELARWWNPSARPAHRVQCGRPVLGGRSGTRAPALRSDLARPRAATAADPRNGSVTVAGGHERSAVTRS